MNRRTLLLAVGGGGVAASALIGSGAFTAAGSQRGTTIEVAGDPDAYLGLEPCPDSPNASYTRFDDSGHLGIELSPANPTIGKGKGGTGLGVNSDSFTYVHDVFQVCNQGKGPVAVWIEATAREPTKQLKADPEYREYADEDRVLFYEGDELKRRLDSEPNAVHLPVGTCTCVGLRTMTKGLEAGDRLLADDEIVIHAKTVEKPSTSK